MNSLFSLDAHDEGYRCMHRNHCSTLHQKPADTNVLADSFDFDSGVAGLKSYAHRAFQVETMVFSLLLITHGLRPLPDQCLCEMRRNPYKQLSVLPRRAE